MYIELEIDAPQGIDATDDERSAPRNQISVRSSFDLDGRWELDAWLRHVGPISGGNLGANFEIDAYTELDLRVAFRASDHIEISLVGQNLLDNRHQEGFSELLDVSLTRIERSYHAQLRWSL